MYRGFYSKHVKDEAPNSNTRRWTSYAWSPTKKGGKTEAGVTRTAIAPACIHIAKWASLIVATLILLHVSWSLPLIPHSIPSLYHVPPTT